MSHQRDLSDVRNHLYDNAELYWWVSVFIALITLVVVLSAVWVANTKFLVVAGIIAIMSPVVISWIREISSSVCSEADRCRRLILYGDSIGRAISTDELAEIRSLVISCRLREAPFVKPYYASSAPVGPNRLADIVAESAYFTKFLSGKMVLFCWVIVSCSLAAVIIMLMIGDVFSNQSMLAGITKSISIFIGFLISGDFGLTLKKYSDLKNEAAETYRICTRLRNVEGLTDMEIFVPVENYNLALSKAPPVPYKLYMKYRDELNESYRSSHASEGL